jgi:cysteine desulfurase
MNYPFYLDYCATTPCAPEVIHEMIPYLATHFGNAASKTHPFGWVAENAVEKARERISNLIGANSKEIIFTSGATESINLAIKGIFELNKGQKQHFITCETEHKAVLDTFEYLEKQGAEVTYLPVNQVGEIDLHQLESSILPHTRMIALMWANNETGVIHPMDEISKLAQKHSLILFTDAVQAVGKIPVSVDGIHLMAFSGHKLYGPKGVGALYVRHNHPLPKPIAQLHGGGHEKGFRSGTLNVPAIVGFGTGAQLREEIMESEGKRLENLRNYFEKSLLSNPCIHLNGSQKNRLPHVTNLAFEGVEGVGFLQKLNQKIAVSSGSACTSISPKPSHVLQAMGLNSDLGRASVRFSLGMSSDLFAINSALEWINIVLAELKVKN